LRVRRVTFLFLLLWAPVNFTVQFAWAQASTQQAPDRSAAKPAEKPSEPAAPQTPAQIELLETHYRFEADGSSRKEVHTVVKINSELGVRQFARLNFDFNRTFETVEIPLVRVTHSSGGTADVLASAITDNPNPAVATAPAYQDVRVKSVRILGLEPSDTLEYRVITTNLHPPLAPDFWLEHSFDRSGVVSKEIFEIDLPSSRHATVRVNPATPDKVENSGEGAEAREVHRWQWPIAGDQRPPETAGKDGANREPDIAVATTSWEGLSIQLDELLTPGAKPLAQMQSHEEQTAELSRRPSVTPEVEAKARDLSKAAGSQMEKLSAIYDFVSQKIATVDLPLGATGFAPRKPAEILSGDYATPEDKFVIFAALAAALDLDAAAALTGYCNPQGTPGVSGFNHLLISASDGKTSYWLDPSLEVAPFGVVSAIPQKCVFVLNRRFFGTSSTGREWQPFERKMPFAATQHVNVDASLGADGKLTAKVKYVMRGDNELLLRIAFHQSSREKWKEVAQLLSLSDGFRGQITDVSASDPMATRDAFTVEYEISQAKFVDWAKKPVRIPAILPLVGLPDPPAGANAAIELGTPLEVVTEGTVKLPEGFTASAPVGTSVARDYATFSSKYDAAVVAGKGFTLTASRHIAFLARQVPGDRGGDYRAFLRAVQNDEAQGFVITGPATGKVGPAVP
jgi:hypothetical protein